MKNSQGLKKTPVGLWYSDGSLNLGQKTRPYNNQPNKKKKKKKKICKVVDFAVVALSSTCSCRNIHIYAGYIPTQW